jgi:hypothetical protein
MRILALAGIFLLIAALFLVGQSYVNKHQLQNQNAVSAVYLL